VEKEHKLLGHYEKKKDAKSFGVYIKGVTAREKRGREGLCFEIGVKMGEGNRLTTILIKKASVARNGEGWGD